MADSDFAISIRGLSKRFQLGTTIRHDTLRDSISGWTGKLLGRGPRKKPSDESEFWALKEVSAEIKRGDALGIIGGNGAGKSTLLKILSQIIEPTEGEVRIRGRVASLLEVGTGFHPELSGRENIYLNGAILGLSRREIKRKFDDIAAFAEVDRFLDTPVKRYSSGMYVRLAFAVAAHLEPEILLVDEVLAVGDASFQKKCLAKMGEVSTRGRTVVFVSHNMVAVQSLCKRAIWLDKGRLRDEGTADQVVQNYLHQLAATATERSWPNPAEAPQCETLRLERVAVHQPENTQTAAIVITKPIELVVEFWNLQEGQVVHASLHVHNEHDVCVFSTGGAYEANWGGKAMPRGLFRTSCTIPAHLLNDGTYRVRLYMMTNYTRHLFNISDVLVFDVVDDDIDRPRAWFGKIAGVVRPRLQWNTECVSGMKSELAGEESDR